MRRVEVISKEEYVEELKKDSNNDLAGRRYWHGLGKRIGEVAMVAGIIIGVGSAGKVMSY